MSLNVIHNLYQEADDIIIHLENMNEISLSLDAKRHFTKIFVLSAASYFEDRIQKMILAFTAKQSNNNEYLINFLKKKAINLQYHTYFNWGDKDRPDKPGKNANVFFSLFGSEFKQKICDKISEDKKVQTAIGAFIEIGHIRNILVHSNFASYNNLPKTLAEFYILYKNAEHFLTFLEGVLINGEL